MSWEVVFGLIGIAGSVLTAVFWLGHWRGRSRTRADHGEDDRIALSQSLAGLEDRLREIESAGMVQRLDHAERDLDRLWDYVRSLVEHDLRRGGVVRFDRDESDA